MPKNYNLLNLTPKDAGELFQFFEKQAENGITFWPSGSTDKDTPNLSHSVLRRKRNCNPDEFRYEILAPQSFYKGNRSSVYDVIDTLSINVDGVNYKSKKPGLSSIKPPRVIKSVYDKLSTSVADESKIDAQNQQSAEDIAAREYAMTQKAGHLHIKEPVHHNETYYLVRRKADGELLSDIILNDLNNTHILTTEQRIKISIALLEALKAQVTNKNIIHRDIKIMNMVVNRSNPKYTATIFDFSLSTSSTDNTVEISGTKLFCSPEVFLSKVHAQTVKMDVFSMGRVLAMLWRVDKGSYNLSGLTEEQYLTCIRNARATVFTLFNDISEKINTYQAAIIREALSKMLEEDPEERCTIDEALELFKDIDPDKVLTSTGNLAAKKGLLSSSPPSRSWGPLTLSSTTKPI